MKILVRAAAAFALIGAFLLTWDSPTPVPTPIHAASGINIGSFHLNSVPARITLYKFSHPHALHGVKRAIGITVIPLKREATSGAHKFTTTCGSGGCTAHIISCYSINATSHHCTSSDGTYYYNIHLNFTGLPLFSNGHPAVEATGDSESWGAGGSGFATGFRSLTCASIGTVSTGGVNCHYDFEFSEEASFNYYCGVVAHYDMQVRCGNGSGNGNRYSSSSYVDEQFDVGDGTFEYVVWGSDHQYCSTADPLDVGCITSTTVS